MRKPFLIKNYSHIIFPLISSHFISSHLISSRSPTHPLTHSLLTLSHWAGGWVVSGGWWVESGGWWVVGGRAGGLQRDPCAPRQSRKIGPWYGLRVAVGIGMFLSFACIERPMSQLQHETLSESAWTLEPKALRYSGRQATAQTANRLGPMHSGYCSFFRPLKTSKPSMSKFGLAHGGRDRC